MMRWYSNQPLSYLCQTMNLHEAFLPNSYSNTLEKGTVAWQAPSNIALVKYWGKTAVQIPRNPSISLTLDACATRTRLHYSLKESMGEGFDIHFYFEGKDKPEFLPKIRTFFERIEPYVPFLNKYRFEIHSENSFPHSSGIASSASSMAALAMCLVEIESRLQGGTSDLPDLRKASFLARLGSGSACRSIAGRVVVWGKHEKIPSSSDLYGVSWEEEVDPVFHTYHDTILLIDRGQKAVSSSLGHQLMEGHSYAVKRFAQAHDHLDQIHNAMRNADLEQFSTLVELEALTLHAMMMTSTPAFLLMQPNTLAVIRKLEQFRIDSGLHPCFTLDAGANVHLLYPESQKEQIDQFIRSELVEFCENGAYICDRVGSGARRISLAQAHSLTK